MMSQGSDRDHSQILQSPLPGRPYDLKPGCWVSLIPSTSLYFLLRRTLAKRIRPGVSDA